MTPRTAFLVGATPIGRPKIRVMSEFGTWNGLGNVVTVWMPGDVPFKSSRFSKAAKSTGAPVSREELVEPSEGLNSISISSSAAIRSGAPYWEFAARSEI